MSTLTTPPVSTLLQTLFADAEATDGPALQRLRAGVDERGFMEAMRDHRSFYGKLRDVYLPVSPDLGRLLYMLARARRAQTIVEFGLSFGISTIHLAAALRDNGGGRVISTEIEPSKIARARKNLDAAGLSDLVEIREGDARETLQGTFDGGIDMILFDGAKDLYRPLLEQLEPQLRPGAVVIADNTSMVDLLGPFLERVRNPENGYVSLALPMDGGCEVAVRAG
ncbi:O-methyltransferase [Minicystis rosea]|nr:O-methyltransferase [Minicystis rosea]